MKLANPVCLRIQKLSALTEKKKKMQCHEQLWGGIGMENFGQAYLYGKLHIVKIRNRDKL